MNRILQTTLLSLALLLPATATAYDFEVDGIYYNINGTNATVTYKYWDPEFNEYSSDYKGELVIPEKVTFDGTTYTVNAISHDAFTNCYLLEKVTIPETVVSIGESAFYDCYNLSEVTCLATTPPELGGRIYDGPSEIHNYFLDTSEDEVDYYWGDGFPTVLLVPNEAYNNYIDYPLWHDSFTIISGKDADRTAAPTIIIGDGYERYVDEYGISDDYITSLYIKDISDLLITFEPGENSELCIAYNIEDYFGNHSYGSENWEEYNYYEPSLFGLESYDGLRYAFTIYAYAVAEGKKPTFFSQRFIVGYFSISQHESYVYDLPYYYVYNNDQEGKNYVYNYPYPIFSNGTDLYKEPVYLYHAGINGVYYKIMSDTTLEVTQGKTNHFSENTWFWENKYECEIIQEIETHYYTGDISIPETAQGIGWHFVYQEGNLCDLEVNGRVISIGDSAFYYCQELTNVIIPNSVTTIGNNAFAECGEIPSMTISNSVVSIGNSVFSGSSIHTLYLQDDGEWHGGSLDVAVQKFYIGSGITAIPGLQVNPREIYSYAAVPPACDENTFTDYTGTLHVPASSLASYFTAPYWCNFANIIGDAVELKNLSLNSDSVVLEVGSELQLTAIATPANANPLNVTWLSSDTTVAVVDNGLVIARRAGECEITAFFLDKQAVCHVKVNAVLPTSLTIDQESALMEVGQQLTLSAMVLPENTTNKTISWSTTDNSVATVDMNGVVTAIAEGECDIVAACGDLQAVCHVKVLNRIVYITLDQHRVNLLPNHILTLTPTTNPLVDDLAVTSSNPAVAAARVMNGVVQVVGISEGSTWIKVNTSDGLAFGDSCLVTVYTMIGDVDGDGYVSISDVTALIDYLLTGNSESINKANADLDYNGSVSIADVTVLIDVLLSGNGIGVEEIINVNNVSFKMIRVAPGTFMMGATEEQGSDAYEWESPVHQLTLSSYMIGETEVTQELWLAVMGTNPSKHTGDLQKPVDNVNWNDCLEFIGRLNELTGKSFRLPTEAEWEYAARGGNKGHGYKYAGSDNIDDVGWISSNAESTTHPVASLQPNELSLYDMTGNVDEWVNDYWGDYTSASQTNPTGPESGTDRVYRGGSWYGSARASRVSYRFHRPATFLRGTMGLRLAL